MLQCLQREEGEGKSTGAKRIEKAGRAEGHIPGTLLSAVGRLRGWPSYDRVKRQGHVQ